jgi:hypothetical protein
MAARFVLVISTSLSLTSAMLVPGLERSAAGIRAMRRFEPGETVLEVSESDVLSEPVGADALPRLAARLLATGAPALRALAVPDALYRWDTSELRELRSPTLEARVARDRVDLERAHAKHGAGESVLQFVDAVALCRAHAIELGGAIHLLPGVDTLGRSAPHGSLRIERTPHTGFRFAVGDDASVAPHALVSLACGWRTNDELLLESGFALPALASDEVPFELDDLFEAARASGALDARLPGARELSLDIIKQLRGLRYLPADEAPCVFAGGIASDSLGMLLQAILVGVDELELLKTDKPALAAAINIGEGVPLSTDHERRVGLALGRLCTHALEVSGVDLRADEAQLLVNERATGRQPGVSLPLGAAPGKRAAEALRARISRARCLTDCAIKCAAWVDRPTAMASLRRPWRANIRTSG